MCRLCDGVSEVDPEILGELYRRLADERGFRIDIGHVALFGVCKGCGAGSESSDSERRREGWGDG